MISPKYIFLIAFTLFAFIAGLFFGLRPRGGEREFTRVEIRGVPLTAEVVADPISRARGLSGRESIGNDQAMLFVFGEAGPHSIWMKEMEFPIDIIWISNGQVIDVEENAPPAKGVPDSALPIYRPDTPAEFVLETHAGFVRENGVALGDPVSIRASDGTLVYPADGRGGPVAAPVLRVPGAEFSIETLRAGEQRGSGFAIGDILEETAAYRKYAITYHSGERLISGIMNVPAGSVPEGGFPLLILNHGLIDPSIYFSGRGSKREQDFFAKNGYVVLHPDYRGHASSSPGDFNGCLFIPIVKINKSCNGGAAAAGHHDFYVGYTEDVIAALDAVKIANPDFIDEDRVGMWGHSMGGGIAARVATLRHDIRAYILFAPISADAEENFYELVPQEVAWLHETYGPAGAEIYRSISPLEYFKDVQAPVQIHHGTADKDVPLRFSEDMAATLRSYEKKVELYIYPGQPHEFIEDWPIAAGRALQFLDYYVKGTR